MYEIEVFISEQDLMSDATEWRFDMLNASDTIIGNRYRDVLKGGNSGDFLEGRQGKDALFGERGDDFLVGGSGNDRLYGGSGDDFVHGGSGTDLLLGGSGWDVFVFKSANDAGRRSARDEIGDFNVRYDWIDLSALDANEGKRGNQTFEFVGRESFSGAAGELRFRNELLSGDTDGDRRSDFEVTVSDVNSLREIDFFL